MKAIDILQWICQQSIDGKLLNLIRVPEEPEQDEEWWFENIGSCPPSPVEAGTYLWYNHSLIGDCICDEHLSITTPDFEIEVPVENGFEYYSFYKVEE